MEGIARDPDEAAAPQGTFGAPTELVAFVGGESIALRWSSPAAQEQVKQHDVYRNGMKVASITPGFHRDFPEKNGNGYIDRDVTPGSSYEYSVQAVDPQGVTSTMSPKLSATAPSMVLKPTVTFDWSKASDLQSWSTDVAKPFLETWYPKAALLLGMPDVTLPMSFKITFDPSYDGVAFAVPGSITISPKYVREHVDDLGMVLHEATHVLVPRNPKSAPSWIREGIADWTREYVLHDRDPIPVRPGDIYTQGYSQGSFFMDWIQRTYNKPIIRAVMIAEAKAAYSDEIFVQHTGKTPVALWTELTGQKIRAPGAIRYPDLPNKCVRGGGGPATIATCNGEKAQSWTVVDLPDGTLSIRGEGGCLEVAGGATEIATPILTVGCNGTGAQVWQHQADGTLRNPQSGRCLDDPAANTTDGTNLMLYDCIGGIAQKLMLP